MPKPLTEAQLINIRISFHTRHLSAFNAGFENVTRCFDRYKNGNTLEEHEKISLRDYALVRSIAALENHTEHLEAQNLSGLSEGIKKCCEVVSFLEQQHPGTQFKLTLFIDQDQGLPTLTTQGLLDFYRSLSKFVSCAPRDSLQPEEGVRPRKG